MRFHREEGGQAVVLIGIVVLGLIMSVGLAMDTGQLYNGRRTAQEAADAAAFAGAVAIYQSGCPLDASLVPLPGCAAAVSAARNDASLNGYATGSPTAGTTVTVAHPPTSGVFVLNDNCVQVTITTQVHTSLVPQQSGFTAVTARGTGCYVIPPTKYAIMALDQACDANALNVGGLLTIHGGSIQVNACAPPRSSTYSAASTGGTVTLDDEYKTDVVGNAVGTWPELHTGARVQPDPFAKMPKPVITVDTPIFGTPQCAPAINQPGVYTGTANSNCQYVFAPGTYIMKGSGMNLSGSNAGACTGRYVTTTVTADVTPGTRTVIPASMTNISVGKMLVIDTGTSVEGVVPSAVTATSFTAIFAKSHTGTWALTGGCAGGTDTDDGGVFFFLTNSNYPSQTGNCANPALKIEGGVSTTLTAPTSGVYQGMLFWQDSSCTVPISIGSAQGALYTSGSIYAPNAAITGNGNGATVVVSQMVAKTVDTQNATFVMNYDQGLNAKSHSPALVE